MKKNFLEPHEMTLVESVLRRHSGVREVTLFGSRAKGTHSPASDIDLSVRGNLRELQTEALASELDELPLPYRFDVLAFDEISSQPLREHINRVGITIYQNSHP